MPDAKVGEPGPGSPSPRVTLARLKVRVWVRVQAFAETRLLRAYDHLVDVEARSRRT